MFCVPAKVSCLAWPTATTGAALFTVTVKVAVAGFVPSLAETVTVVVPSGKVLPLAGTAVAGTTPATASVALTVKSTIAPSALVEVTVRFPGVVIAGTVVSATVTVKVEVLALAAASVAVIVTMVVPTAKVEPLACE